MRHPSLVPFGLLALCLAALPAPPAGAQEMSPEQQAAFAALIQAVQSGATRITAIGSEHTILHHQMQVTLDPDARTLSATTTESIQTQMETRQLEFLLYEGFEVSAITLMQGATPIAIDWSTAPIGVSAQVDQFLADYPSADVVLLNGLRQPIQVLTLTLPHFTATGADYAVTFTYAGDYSLLPATADLRGEVYLDGGDLWFPDVFGPRSTFTLDLTIPLAWSAYSQGHVVGEEESLTQRTVHFVSEVKQGQIIAVAGPLTIERDARDGIDFVSVRRASAPVAKDWVEASAAFLAFAAETLGPYPYESFALIEAAIPAEPLAHYRWRPADRGGLAPFPGGVRLDPAVLTEDFTSSAMLGELLLTQWIGQCAVWPATDEAGGDWTPGLRQYIADLLYTEREQGPEAARELRRQYLEELGYAFLWADPPPINAYSTELPPDLAAVSPERMRPTILARDLAGRAKVALLLHEWRVWLGDEAFFAMLRDFVQSHLHGEATLADLTGALYDALAAQGLTEETKSQWVRRYAREWYDQRGLPDYVLSYITLERVPDSGTYHGAASLAMTLFDATLLPPVRLVIYDGTFETPIATYFDDAVPFERGAANTTFEAATPPAWAEYDPEFHHLRWIPNAEKAPSFEAIRAGYHCAMVLTERTLDAVLPAFEVADLLFPPGQVDRYTPDQAKGDALREKNLFLVGTPDDLEWMADTVDLEQFDLELGAHEAVFQAIKLPANPEYTIGIALGADDEALAGLIALLPAEALMSRVAVREGAVVEATRWIPTERHLRIAVHDK